MGRAHRGKLQRILEGKEIPRSVLIKLGGKPTDKLLHCKKCNHLVPESRARQHMRECWPLDIGDNDPIPTEVPEHLLAGGLRVRLADNPLVIKKES